MAENSKLSSQTLDLQRVNEQKDIEIKRLQDSIRGQKVDYEDKIYSLEQANQALYTKKKKKAKLLTVVPFTELSFNFKRLDDMVKLREAVQTHYNQS